MATGRVIYVWGDPCWVTFPILLLLLRHQFRLMQENALEIIDLNLFNGGSFFLSVLSIPQLFCKR